MAENVLMIFGDAIFADDLFADGAQAIATPPIPPPAEQAWIEQCPIDNNFIAAAKNGSTWNNQSKQSSSWAQQNKNTIPTNKCETS